MSLIAFQRNKPTFESLKLPPPITCGLLALSLVSGCGNNASAVMNLKNANQKSRNSNQRALQGEEIDRQLEASQMYSVKHFPLNKLISALQTEVQHGRTLADLAPSESSINGYVASETLPMTPFLKGVGKYANEDMCIIICQWRPDGTGIKPETTVAELQNGLKDLSGIFDVPDLSSTLHTPGLSIDAHTHRPAWRFQFTDRSSHKTSHRHHYSCLRSNTGNGIVTIILKSNTATGRISDSILKEINPVEITISPFQIKPDAVTPDSSKLKENM